MTLFLALALAMALTSLTSPVALAVYALSVIILTFAAWYCGARNLVRSRRRSK